jgi:inner membrane transporter RhtA
LWPVALLLLAMTSVQAGASLAKSLFPLIGPVGVVAVRLVFGMLILWVVLRPWRARITRASLPPLLVYGLTLGIMNSLFYLSLSHIPLGIAVAIEFLGPLTVAVLGSHRLTDFLWILLAAAGLVLLLPIAHVGSGVDPLGAAYALGAGVMWGVYILVGQKTGADFGARAAALGSTISAVCVAPIGLITAGPAILSPAVLIPGAVVALLSTAIPYSLEMIALTRLPTRSFGILMSLEPALGALFGYVYLREYLTSAQWLAIGLIICASIGATASSQQAPHEIAEPV